MPAGIVKPLQGAQLVAHEQYLLVTQCKNLKCSSGRHVAGPADIDPVAKPNALQFPFILARVVVGIRREAFRMLGQAVVAQLGGSTQHRSLAPQLRSYYL